MLRVAIRVDFQNSFTLKNKTIQNKSKSHYQYSWSTDTALDSIEVLNVKVHVF